MKILRWLVVAGMLVSAHARAEIRTFTSSDGRTVNAELVALEDEVAVLRLPNRKLSRVPLASLSEADRAFAKTWWEENRNKLDSMEVVLSIAKKTERIDRKVSGGGGGGNRAPMRRTSTKDEYQYVCKLQSYVPRDVEDVTVEYTIYKRVSRHDKKGSDTTDDLIEGGTTIRRLPALGTVEFETDMVLCEDYSQSGGNAAREWRRESIRGVVFTLSAGGKEFLRRSEPENLVERLDEEIERQEAKEIERQEAKE